MWHDTRISKLLGIRYPILQGPFGGGLSTPELVAAVSNSGGMGGYGAYMMNAKEIYELDKQIRFATDKPYNLNLWVSDTDVPDHGISDAQFEQAAQIFKPYFDEAGIPLPEKPPSFTSRFENQLQAVLSIRPKAFSFVFGSLSADVMEQCRKLGITTIGAATTLDEAIALEASGVDMIVASGFEAGGHRPSFLASAEQSVTGTFVLTQLIREKVKVPVIAAGGIADARGVAAAFTLGAEAVQIGTAFLATEESGALPVHRQMLFSDASRHTLLTRAFTGRLGRGIVSRPAVELAGKENMFLPFPLQTTFISPLRKAALEQKKWDMVFFWGGQVAPVLKHTRAAELMQAIITETSYIIK